MAHVSGFKYELNECLERGKAYITSMAGNYKHILQIKLIIYYSIFV